MSAAPSANSENAKASAPDADVPEARRAQALAAVEQDRDAERRQHALHERDRGVPVEALKALQAGLRPQHSGHAHRAERRRAQNRDAGHEQRRGHAEERGHRPGRRRPQQRRAQRRAAEMQDRSVAQGLGDAAAVVVGVALGDELDGGGAGAEREELDVVRGGEHEHVQAVRLVAEAMDDARNEDQAGRRDGALSDQAPAHVASDPPRSAHERHSLNSAPLIQGGPGRLAGFRP